MAEWQLTGPDGSKYRVTAPDNATEADVRARLQQQLATQPATDPYKGKSLEDIQKMYRAAGDDQTRRAAADAYVRGEHEGSLLNNVGMAASDFVRDLGRGQLGIGGYLDEANAATSALEFAPSPGPMGRSLQVNQKQYGENLDYQRARDRYLDENMPVLSGATQLAGGIGGALLTAPYLAPSIGANVARPLIQRALVGGAEGAGVGAVDWYGRGEGGATNRSINAAGGAAFGGVLGAVAPYAAQAIGSGVQRLMDIFSSKQVLDRLGLSRAQADMILEQLATDDTASGAGAARIREGGPDAMLVDAGTAASNMLDTALERSGPGSSAARQAIEQRAGNANQNLTGELDRALGTPVGVETQQEAIRTGSRAQRGAEFDAAYDAPIDYSTPAGRELETMLTTQVPRQAIRAANELIRTELGNAGLSRQIRVTQNADGTLSFDRLPDVRQWHYITQGLNEVADRAHGAGKMGGTSKQGRAYGNLAGDINSLVRELVPEYGTAMATASDVIRRIEGVEIGEGMLSDSVTRDAFARALRNMTPGERAAVRQGLRSEIDELMARVKQIPSDPNIAAREVGAVLAKMTSRASREKLALAIGDPQYTRAVTTQIDRAMRALEMRASVARGARTFGRQQMDERAKAQTEGVIHLASTGQFVKAAQRAIQWMAGMSPKQRLDALDNLYGGIANAMTNVRGTAAEQYLHQLRTAIQQRASNRSGATAAGNIAGAATYGGGMAVSPNESQPR